MTWHIKERAGCFTTTKRTRRGAAERLGSQPDTRRRCLLLLLLGWGGGESRWRGTDRASRPPPPRDESTAARAEDRVPFGTPGGTWTRDVERCPAGPYPSPLYLSGARHTAICENHAMMRASRAVGPFSVASMS
jgi:hypothetical protein